MTTTIQAYKRTKRYVHDFPDLTLEFLPNDRGDIVCAVEDESAVERLLQTPTGFRIYAPNEFQRGVSKLIDSVPLPDTSPFILVDGEVRVDLRAMDDDTLRSFAAANEVRAIGNLKGDRLRQKIVDVMKSGDEG